MTNNPLQKELPDIAPFINQSVLDPHIDHESLIQLCQASKHYCFGGLCTSLVQLSEARKELGRTTTTKLIAVIAFPFGAIPSELKYKEADWAASQGAEELDIVPNFKSLKKNNSDAFGEELSQLCSIGLPVRVILNMSRLSQQELYMAVNTAIDAGASSLQTSNGFSNPVSCKEIRLLSEMSKGRCAITAAGGLNTLDQALEVITEGASRLCTSKGLELMKSLRQLSKK